MKLARFIQTNTEQLLEDWEQAATEIAPEFRVKDNHALRHHVRAILEFIARDIDTSQTTDESARKALGKGKAPIWSSDGEHGTYRIAQGLSMLQMMQELRALRARVTQGWGDEQRGLSKKDIGELVRFNECIDQLIANSVASYSALKEQETRQFETMLTLSQDPAAIFDLEGKLLFLNEAMARLVSATPWDAVGKTPFDLGLEFAAEFYEELARTAATGLSQRGEFHCRSSSGLDLYFDSQLVPVFDGHNRVEAVVKNSRDVTERKKTDHEAWQRANFDLLTGIPNRRLFVDRLEQAMLEADRNGSSFALLFIDLDRFKQANDQIGHAAGDRLLVQVAERINGSVRAVDTLARLGGDEFTLLLKETGREGAKEAARALLTNLERVFEIDSHQVQISGSIGLTLFPDDGNNVSQLMHNADQAMFTAKKRGGQQVQIFEPSMAHSESEHMQLNRELKDAIKEGQLEVYYQPIIDVRTGEISRAEALLRWNHPAKGLLTPGAFFSLTEQSGMTDSITAFVLGQAISCSLRWRDRHEEAFPIHINESPASFITRTLVDQWRARLTQLGLDDSQITMELSPASLNSILAAGFNPVRSMGLAGLRLNLAIDDFGIKPFSLSALQGFKMDSVKVDRELIRGVGQGGDADDVLEAIIAMTHAIDVKVVAVGVENVEQLQFLTRAGCDYVQGFLFSKPLKQDEFEALLKRDRPIQPSRVQ